MSAPYSYQRQFVTRKIIVAFYASSRHGSEYRGGNEYIAYAATLGFDLAIVSDLDQNDSAQEAAARFGLNVVTIPSVICRQKLLYRVNDLVPQLIWHLRVARWLKFHARDAEVIWLHNGALPWLPLLPYLGLARTLIWGPVGGGETLPAHALKDLSSTVRWREHLRESFEQWGLRRKARALRRRSTGTRVIALARTEASRSLLARHLPLPSIPIFPEILQPILANSFSRTTTSAPRFVWVGQNIPRKNLPLALRIFQRLRSEYFPSATLDIFGATSPVNSKNPNVTFHGWVSRIDWESFRHNGVLLFTSYREGLPSAVLEAICNGLFCVCSPVGALPSLNTTTVALLRNDEYPDPSDSTLARIADDISRHLGRSTIELPESDFRASLTAYLRDAGVST